MKTVSKMKCSNAIRQFADCIEKHYRDGELTFKKYRKMHKYVEKIKQVLDRRDW